MLLSAPSVPQSLKRIAYQTNSDKPAATDSGARIERMFNWMVAWATQRLVYTPDSKRFLVSLAVTSEPQADAIVTLRHLDNNVVGNIHTQGAFTEVYRGLYHYKIERERFKIYDSGASTDTAYLNLVDWSWTETGGLVCKLVPKSSVLKPLPCNLR
jgi:hypothetical protein